MEWCRHGARGLAVLMSAMMVLGIGACAAPVSVPAAAPALTPDGDQLVETSFASGAVRGGVLRYAVPRGSVVRLVVHSDVADLVHVHGYDRRSYVTAGASTTVRFVADQPGVFEVELEQRSLPVVELQVTS